MQFKYIRYDESILETDLKDIHLRKLKIASENIIDFNKRNPEETDIEYEYQKKVRGSLGKESYGFDRIRPNIYQHYSDIYFNPNWIIFFSQSTDDFENLTKIFINYTLNSFRHYQLIYGAGEIDLFLKLFEGYYPKGDFLNENQIEAFKKETNEMCRIVASYKSKN